jgi:chromosome segregation ATPase
VRQELPFQVKGDPAELRGQLDGAGRIGGAIVSEDPRRTVAELAKGMEAAGALIESLEEEAANLRHDLERATAGLRAAQTEVSSSAGNLEEKERALSRAQKELDDLRAENSDLRRRHSDEQLRLSNEHINELAAVRRRLEEQRRLDVEAASSESRLDSLKEEFRRERDAVEARHREEVETLKQASEHWEERLRTGYREQEERHAAELEAVRREAEERIGELERSLEEEVERLVAEEKSASGERQEAALRVLRNAAAGRELELQKDYQAVVETQQAEIESLREELEASRRSAEDSRRQELREVKALAENRERELRKAQASKLAEAKADADRRVAAIQAQREADNRALQARHEEESARLRRGFEEQLVQEDERRKSETWALEERVEEFKIHRDTELRAFSARLKELESSRLAQKSSAEADMERVVERFGAEISTYENRVGELQEALQESETLRDDLERQLDAHRSGPAAVEPSGEPPEDEQPAEDEPADHPREIEVEKILVQERIQDLEARLREAREESRRTAEGLESALESLNRLSDPERRLREGISLFNASEHARTVASISKSLGLPRVHVGLDDGTPGKPTLTFLWSEMAWRRYVSDPTEGIEEPRVYLAGTGDEPSEIEESERQANARMDARGRLTLGVQAR